MEEKVLNLACFYSPRFVLEPVLIAVVEHASELERFWDPTSPISLWPHGVYIVKETEMPKKQPENLYDEGGPFPTRGSLEREAILLQAQADQHCSSWVARRLQAIVGFLGYTPKASVVPSGHPRKIPNRRLP